MEWHADTLEFDADFENGSMDRMIRQGLNWYHLMLRPDTWFFFHFRLRGCQGREIIFECTRRQLADAPECPFSRKKPSILPAASAAPCWPEPAEWRPFVSCDGRTWEPVDHIEKDPRFSRSYRFVHRFTENEAYVCYTHPYTYSDMLAWLGTLESHPLVQVGDIGNSRNGVSQPVLTITANPDARDLVVLIAREDSDEPLASWGIEGVVRRLLAEESRDLLQRFTFKIVPMVCVDGVIAGATHSAGYGYGGGRWHEDPAPAEIENVKLAIRKWMEQGDRLKLGGKLHGGYGLRPDQQAALACQDTLTSSPGIRDALMRYTGEFWVGKPTELQIRPRGFFERFLLDEFGSSDSFGTHIQGATPENARRCGEGLVENVSAWLLAADA